MKIYETLISIMIYFLILLASYYAYSACRNCISDIRENTRKNEAVINYDSKLRNQINQIRIPYWKNFENMVINNEIFQTLSNNEKIKIEKILELRNKENKVCGLKVYWKYSEKEYLTIERFASRNIFCANYEK